MVDKEKVHGKKICTLLINFMLLKKYFQNLNMGMLPFLHDSKITMGARQAVGVGL